MDQLTIELFEKLRLAQLVVNLEPFLAGSANFAPIHILKIYFKFVSKLDLILTHGRIDA